jgi:hypothetical protein
VLKAILGGLFLLTVSLSLKAQCFESNRSFYSGEKVTYKAYYNWHFIWLNAGGVSFTVKKQIYKGNAVYQLMSLGSTYSNYDFFYKVRDTFITYVDTLKLTPYLFQRRSNEGGSSVSETYRFDKGAKQISSVIKKDDEPVVKSTIPWQECTVDVLTMVYWARNIDFSKYKTDDKIPIRMVADGAISDLYIRYLGKETIDTKDGRTFRCLKFSPLLMEGTIFEAGEDMTVWVTDDDNRIPIIVEAKILIGSVKAMFESAVGLRFPIKAEIVKIH